MSVIKGMNYFISTVKVIKNGRDSQVVKIGSIGQFFNPNTLKNSLHKHYRIVEPTNKIALHIIQTANVGSEDYNKRNNELMELRVE